MWRVKVSSPRLRFGSMLTVMGFMLSDGCASTATKPLIYLGSPSLACDLAQKPSRFVQRPVGVAAFLDENLSLTALQAF